MKMVLSELQGTLIQLLKESITSYKLLLPVIANLFYYHLSKDSPHLPRLLTFVISLMTTFHESSLQLPFVQFLSQIIQVLSRELIKNGSISGCSQSLDSIIQFYTSIIDQSFCSPVLYNAIHQQFPYLLFLAFLSHYESTPSTTDSVSFHIVTLDSSSPLLFYASNDLQNIYLQVFHFMIEFNQFHASCPLFVEAGSFLLLLLQLAVHSISFSSLLQVYSKFLYSVSPTLQSPFGSLASSTSHPLLALSSFLTTFSNTTFIQDHLQDVFSYWRDMIQKKRMKRVQEIEFYEQVIVMMGENSGVFLDVTRIRLVLDILFPFVLSNHQAENADFVPFLFLPLIDRNRGCFEYSFREVVLNAHKSFFFNVIQNMSIPSMLVILNTVQLRNTLTLFCEL